MSATPFAASASASDELLHADADCAGRDLHLRDARALVRLGVRPQAQAVRAREAGHAFDVALDRVEVDHQRRRLDRVEQVAWSCGRSPHAARSRAAGVTVFVVHGAVQVELVVPADEREALGL